MGLARKVHEDHVAEIPEKEVLRHFSEVLPDLGRSKEDAKRIIAEIRDRSGLLVERRPGFFAFSHLTFQEYLCALDYARIKHFEELCEHYEEPWWHEVIVLAAGSPGAGGGVIPRKLLAKKEAAAVLLAAQCLYTEADMPLQVREKIERELSKLMPPRSLGESQKLSRSGVIAAPLLARFLEGQEPEVTFWVLRTLYWINYAPVLPEIARCIVDQREIPDYKMTVSLYASLILAHQAINSDLARATLRDTVERLPADHARNLLVAVKGVSLGEPRAASILESVLKARVRRVSSPKRAKGTA